MVEPDPEIWVPVQASYRRQHNVFFCFLDQIVLETDPEPQCSRCWSRSQKNRCPELEPEPEIWDHGKPCFRWKRQSAAFIALQIKQSRWKSNLSPSWLRSCSLACISEKLRSSYYLPLSSGLAKVQVFLKPSLLKFDAELLTRVFLFIKIFPIEKENCYGCQRLKKVVKRFFQFCCARCQMASLREAEQSYRK